MRNLGKIIINCYCMSLTNFQIEDLSRRMNFPLAGVFFKTELSESPLQYNTGYVVNLEDEFDEDGNRNEGTHYVCFYVKKNKNGKIEPIAFDSYGVAPCKEIVDYIGLGHTPPYNTKDIQSIMQECCGWYVCAFLYWISSFHNRTHSLYEDAENFTDLFLDLNKSADWKHNEFVLKHFFRDSRKEVRDKRPIEVFEGTGFKPIYVEDIGKTHTITVDTQKG